MRKPQRAVSRGLRTAARLPIGDQLATLRAIALAVVVEIAVRRASLPALCQRLGVELDTDPGLARSRDPEPTLTPRERRDIWAARRIMRYWPFGFGPCLREALLIGYALRQRHPVLRLGVRNEAGRIAAHAWLELDGWVIGERTSYEPLVTGLALSAMEAS